MTTNGKFNEKKEKRKEKHKPQAQEQPALPAQTKIYQKTPRTTASEGSEIAFIFKREREQMKEEGTQNPKMADEISNSESLLLSPLDLDLSLSLSQCLSPISICVSLDPTRRRRSLWNEGFCLEFSGDW